MACIRKIIDLTTPAGQVWDVIRDVGAVHTRFAPGFATNTVLEKGARVVTFANGLTVRELIVDIDDELRRLAYSAVGASATHHNASFEVVELSQGRTRIVWTADVLPDSAKDLIEPMMAKGSEVILHTLSRLGQ
jgi:hypothetical protein